jgi:hypothetical protein
VSSFNGTTKNGSLPLEPFSNQTKEEVMQEQQKMFK